MCIGDLVKYLESSLCHDNLDRLSILKLDVHGQNPDCDFVKDALPAIATAGNLNHALLRERRPRTDNRMPCKGDLANGGKDTQMPQHVLRLCFEYEDRLREIHLT